MELISGVFTVLPIYKTMEVSNNIKWMYVSSILTLYPDGYVDVVTTQFTI